MTTALGVGVICMALGVVSIGTVLRRRLGAVPGHCNSCCWHGLSCRCSSHGYWYCHVVDHAVVGLSAAWHSVEISRLALLLCPRWNTKYAAKHRLSRITAAKYFTLSPCTTTPPHLRHELRQWRGPPPWRGEPELVLKYKADLRSDDSPTDGMMRKPRRIPALPALRRPGCVCETRAVKAITRGSVNS